MDKCMLGGGRRATGSCIHPLGGPSGGYDGGSPCESPMGVPAGPPRGAGGTRGSPRPRVPRGTPGLGVPLGTPGHHGCTPRRTPGDSWGTPGVPRPQMFPLWCPPKPHLSILRRWLGHPQLVFSILVEAFSSPSVGFWGGSAWRGGFGQYPETDLSKFFFTFGALIMYFDGLLCKPVVLYV